MKGFDKEPHIATFTTSKYTQDILIFLNGRSQSSLTHRGISSTKHLQHLHGTCILSGMVHQATGQITPDLGH